MTDAFRLGGWGMYPTAIAGIALVVVALRYASQPDPRSRQIVRSLSILTLMVGCLGFITGVIRTFVGASNVEQYELGRLLVVGIGESLHNVALALVTMVIAWTATTVGAARTLPSGPAALADPHQPH